MFEKLSKDRPLEQLRETAKRLISAQGESNAQSIAIKLIDQYERLDARQRQVKGRALVRGQPVNWKIGSLGVAVVSYPDGSEMLLGDSRQRNKNGQ